MKNHLLLAVFITVQLISYAQEDNQWLIHNRKGKFGTLPNLANNYNQDLSGSTFITIEGVAHPNRSNQPKTKNNLFIIYSDGTFFNSRSKYDESSKTYPGEFFYPNGPGQNPGQQKHSFSTGGKIINYLYLTNIYEEDDLPPLLKVTSGNTGDNAPDPYVPGVTTPDKEITAIHDVVRRKDFVLIIDNIQLRNRGIVDKYILDFGAIRALSNLNPMSGDYFDLNPAFKDGGISTAVYPRSAYIGSVGETIELDIDANDFVYINLKPKSSLDNYYQPTEAGTITHEAIFKINHGNNVYAHNEYLVAAHDPNFVKLLNVYEVNNKKYLKYQVSFKNITEYPAHDLKVEIEFDRRFTDNVRLTKLSAGKNTILFKNPNALHSFGSSDFCSEYEDGHLRVTFPPQWSVAAGKNKDMAKGSMEFIVEVDRNTRWHLTATNTKLMETKVYFNDWPFYVDLFYDLTLKKLNNVTNVNPTNRPITTSLNNLNAYYPCARI